MESMSTGMTWGRPGEKVGFIDHATMATLGQGLIMSYTQLGSDRFEVEFAASVPAALAVGDALENLTWAPDFTARDSMFGTCRARGSWFQLPAKW